MRGVQRKKRPGIVVGRDELIVDMERSLPGKLMGIFQIRMMAVSMALRRMISPFQKPSSSLMMFSFVRQFLMMLIESMEIFQPFSKNWRHWSGMVCRSRNCASPIAPKSSCPIISCWMSMRKRVWVNSNSAQPGRALLRFMPTNIQKRTSTLRSFKPSVPDNTHHFKGDW